MGSPTIQTPTPPAQPTAGESMADYVANLPKLYETQMEYAPKFAELSQEIAERLYPTTAGLQEKLATQAVEGMGSEVPEWMRQQHLSKAGKKHRQCRGRNSNPFHVGRLFKRRPETILHR